MKKMLMKKSAELALKTAVKAAGLASTGGIFEPKAPLALKKFTNK